MADTIQDAANSMLGADTFPPSMDSFEELRLPSGLSYRDWSRIAQREQSRDLAMRKVDSSIAESRLKILKDVRERQALEGETKVLAELEKLDPTSSDYRQQSFAFHQYTTESPAVRYGLLTKDRAHTDFQSKLSEVAKLSGESGASDDQINERLATARDLLRRNGPGFEAYQRLRAGLIREHTFVSEARKSAGSLTSQQKRLEGVAKDLGTARGEAQELISSFPESVRENNPAFFEDFAAAKSSASNPIRVTAGNRKNYRDRLTDEQFKRAGQAPNGILIPGPQVKSSKAVSKDIVGNHLFGRLWWSKIKGKKDAKITGEFPLQSYIKDVSANAPDQGPGWQKGLLDGDKLNVGQAQKLVDRFTEQLRESPGSPDKFILPYKSQTETEDYTNNFEDFLKVLHSQYGSVLDLESLWKKFMLKSPLHGEVATGRLGATTLPTPTPEASSADPQGDFIANWKQIKEQELLSGN